MRRIVASLLGSITAVLVACAPTIAPPAEQARSSATAASAPATIRSTTPATIPSARVMPPATAAPRPTITLLASTTPTTAPRYDLALIGATLIDGTGAAPLPNAVVTIRGDRIVAVGTADTVPFAPDTPTRDLRGLTILPGVINAHVHTDSLSDAELSAWTRAGITTIRDLGGPGDALLERRRRLAAANDPALPRLLAAGPFVTVPGGHPIPAYGLNNEIVTVRGVDDARAQATALLDAGADVIKIAVSGRTDVAWPELSDDEIRAITATAHARGARVTAHVDRAAGLRRAVLNGIDDAAHLPRDALPDDLIALMVERNVALIPTIDVYEALAEQRGAGEEWRRNTLPVMQNNLRRFVAAGGLLALGDDWGNPGVALGMPLPELRHWLEAGITPVQALVAATHGSARVCGLDDRLGTIQPDMIADLLVINGDPLAEIGALERVALVIHNGVIVAP